MLFIGVPLVSQARVWGPVKRAVGCAQTELRVTQLGLCI